MKRNQKLKVLFTAGIAVLARAAAAQADVRDIGNGGGAWVCRNAAGAIASAQVLDLFEAQTEFGLTLQTLSGSRQAIVEAMVTKMHWENNPSVRAILNRLNYLDPTPGRIHYQSQDLRVIDDAAFRLNGPAADQCPNGTFRYEQVVNYVTDTYILVNQPLFSALTAVHQAALVMHEALYFHRRTVFGDETSAISRLLNGLIFSTLDPNQVDRHARGVFGARIHSIRFDRLRGSIGTENDWIRDARYAELRTGAPICRNLTGQDLDRLPVGTRCETAVSTFEKMPFAFEGTRYRSANGTRWQDTLTGLVWDTFPTYIHYRNDGTLEGRDSCAARGTRIPTARELAQATRNGLLAVIPLPAHRRDASLLLNPLRWSAPTVSGSRVSYAVLDILSGQILTRETHAGDSAYHSQETLCVHGRD